MNNIVKRGDIYYAELSGTKGSEQSGIRPVLIIQNDIGNRFAPTVIVAVITTSSTKKNLVTHVNIGKRFGLTQNSTVLLEQVRTIDKTRLKSKIGNISDEDLKNEINKAIKVSLDV